jgi:hypothetical protein
LTLLEKLLKIREETGESVNDLCASQEGIKRVRVVTLLILIIRLHVLAAFSPKKITPGNHSIEGWVGTVTNLGILNYRYTSCSCRKLATTR